MHQARYALSFEMRITILQTLFVYKKEILTGLFMGREDNVVSRQLGLRWRLDQIPSN